MRRAFAAVVASLAMTASAEAAEVRLVHLDRPQHLALRRGDTLVMHGHVASDHDGMAWDALTHDDGKEVSEGGLYVLDGVGLRVEKHEAARHLTRFIATGEPAPRCAAAGVAPPCLVPRVAALAHERLLTTDAFVATLRGSMVIAEVPAPVPVSFGQRAGRVIGSTLALGLPLAALVLLFIARRRRSPIGRIHTAARDARAAIRLDPTMARVGAEIDGLVARGQELVDAREVHLARRVRLDRDAVERKLAIWSRRSGAAAEETLEWLRKERAEIDKLDADIASCDEALEQIAASLRVIALSGRARRDERPRALTEVRDELAFRERARAELD